MMETMTVNETEYAVQRLLGKGKGGYCYLVSDAAGSYVLKTVCARTEHRLFSDKLYRKG